MTRAGSGSDAGESGPALQAVGEFAVEWGDCDEAGIVFYPNYLRWFDASFQKLLRARGCDQRSLRKEYGLVGTPIVDAKASFRATATYGDVLEAEAAVFHFGRTSFTVIYRLSKDGGVVAEGEEVRIWARRKPDGQLQTVEIPQSFRKALA